MRNWDDGLEGVHRDIAADESRVLHILAGPGTGKTFAMMRQIARVPVAASDGLQPGMTLWWRG